MKCKLINHPVGLNKPLDHRHCKKLYCEVVLVEVVTEENQLRLSSLCQDISCEVESLKRPWWCSG